MITVDTKSTADRKIINIRELGFKNILVLGHYNYKQAKDNLATHTHPGIIEICFLDKGSQHYMINQEKYLLKGGDLLVTYPDEPHGTSSYPEEKGSLYWMMIKIPENSGRILNLSPTNSRILIDRLLAFKSRQFRALPGIRNSLSSIFQAYNKTDDPLKMIEINSNILAFLLKVIHSGEAKEKKETSSEIKIICEYILNNLQEDVELEELAAKINLSLSRFKHRFKEETGVPPKEYILRKKIERAKEIMSTSSEAINEVAYSLGFTSSSYFATVFKRFTGQTPSDYRERKGC
ncbi:AraC family transcriptional regulator [Puteibacter caeruleilacunae]|nr:AraC family transcriptional regulator [Puteibacter caeruleilacunae]